MDFATSLYLGNQIISAGDSRINRASYKDLGLRCCFCGEPVFLKKGEQRRPHFAYFSDISSRTLEECLLKQSQQSQPQVKTDWYRLTPVGEQQRLTAFQEHFLSLLVSHLPGCANILSLTNQSYSAKVEQLVADCTQHLISNSKKIDRYLKIFKTNSSLLHRTIAGEAIRYLCVASSRNLLKALILSVIVNQLKGWNFFLYATFRVIRGKFIDSLEIEDICEVVTELIFSVRWVEVFNGLRNYEKIDYKGLTLPRNFIHQIVDDAYLYIEKNRLFYGEARAYYLICEQSLVNLEPLLSNSKPAQLLWQNIRNSDLLKQHPEYMGDVKQVIQQWLEASSGNRTVSRFTK